MAKASEQFRQSDVTLWGIVALVCAGLAVFGANVSLLVPQSIIGSLHQPRVAGASVESLREDVRELRDETARLTRENQQIAARFAVQERAGSEVTRRVGALEITLPRLIEPETQRPRVDMSSTASIAGARSAEVAAEGGSASVTQTPLIRPSTVEQPLPAPIVPTSFGVAIGDPVTGTQASAEWDELSLKLGPLLFGLSPLLSSSVESEGRIVAGPVANADEAQTLCDRFARVAISCTPVPYDGTPLILPTAASSEGG